MCGYSGMGKKLAAVLLLAMAITGLLVAAWPVYAADVSGALYTADVVATNSGDATSGVAAAVDINTQALINGKYVTEDLLNTALQTSGGSDVPFMPGVGSNPWVYWLPSIEASESIPYVFYCGGPAMQEGFYYFPDDGGMTTDDDDSLELGNIFQIEQKGYVDTSAGSGKNLVCKDDAIITYTSDGEITSAINTALPEYSSTSDGFIYANNIVYATAQAAATGTVNSGNNTFRIGQTYSSGYPSVAATNGGTTSPSTYNHTVNLPSGIASGNLLIALFGTTSAATPTFPAGWSQLFFTSNTFSAWYKIANGTEGASITVTTSSSVQSAHITYRITGYSGTPEVGTSATGSSANPDPPNLSPSWGAANTLWIACEGITGPYTVSSYPTNYSSGLNYYFGGGGPSVGAAQRNLNASSENPGTFTLGSSSTWVANTIAVAPIGYRVDRGYLYFDTSSIPDGAEITSAVLCLYGETDESDTDFDIVITNGQPTYPTDPLTAGDFDKTHYSGTGNGTFNTSGFSTSGYNEITLNSTGLGWIDDDGVTKLCLRSSRDVAATTPTGDEYIAVYSSDETGTSKDPYLEVAFGYPIVSVSGIESQLMTVKTSADGTDFFLQIYDEDDVLLDSDTAALDGASVPPNDNGWSFITNGSMPYMEYQKIWVGGTLVQHIVYERDTTFHDQTEYDNDATPTFITATTDPDVTVIFENFKPRAETEYAGGAGEEGGVITTVPEEPEEFYTGGGTGFDHLPGAEMLNTMLDAMDFPRDLFWIWLVYGAAAGFVLLGYQFIRSSLLFPALIGFVIILVASLVCHGDPVELWTILPYGIMSAGFVVSERVFGW
jgi:hypothetical protein